LTSQQLGIQGLGWIVRRTMKPPPELVPFYIAAWGLRAPRPPGPTGAIMLWAGDVTMFEVSTLTAGASTQSRTDEMSVMMRSDDFPKALSRMRNAGASLVAERAGPPPSALLTDPEGRLLGLIATDDTAPTESVSRVPSLPDLPPLPAEIGGIARVVLRVADPQALAAFYQRVLGLPLTAPASENGALLSLGRGISLELRPGGHRHDPPANRNEVPDVWILRVTDHDALAERLRSMDVKIINRVEITGGILSYAVDPEGHLFGIQQRTPDLLPAGKPERVEETAARAAWADRAM
jgi:predicted enzyme related to lactoylglutathione lyase